MWFQKTIQLKARQRGFHLITDEIQDVIREFSTLKIGLCHIFIQHTSAGISINENADPSVLRDFEDHFNRMIPEDASLYRHGSEGTDDMPAHIKSIILGSELSVPIESGRMKLGTWQGIYLSEHRNHGGSRKLVITIQGQD